MNRTPHQQPLRWFLQLSATIGATAFLSLSLPTGCSSSIPPAPELYRLQNQSSRRPFLPDVTVEQLQACVDESAADLDDGPGRVEATVRVNQDGQVVNVDLECVPDRAPELAACTRLALRAMVVPPLPLRSNDGTDEKNTPASSGSNEMANPIVLGEALIVLAEFMAQHGGRAILYAVTLEVAAATTVAAVHELRKRRKKKDECTDHYENCIGSALYRHLGRGAGDSRCGACANMCIKNNATWPNFVGGETCDYNSKEN